MCDSCVPETMLPMPKFQLPCGGVGVDSDTVWHDTHTPTAARVVSLTPISQFEDLLHKLSQYLCCTYTP